MQLSGKVRNSITIENLAEVDIIFSDKTGTLTRNEMTFHSLVDSCHKTHNISQCVSGRRADTAMDPPALFAFALCNTVLPQHKEQEILYQAESPDEIAFVDTAALYGLRLVSK